MSDVGMEIEKGEEEVKHIEGRRGVRQGWGRGTGTSGCF